MALNRARDRALNVDHRALGTYPTRQVATVAIIAATKTRART
jgi:hypothetical protein